VTASVRVVLVTATGLLAAAIAVGIVLTTARQPDDVRFDELGAVNIVEVVGSDLERIEAAVSDAGGEIIEVLEPSSTRTVPIVRALFGAVHDRDEQREVIERLESEGLTARPAMVFRRDG
jgi:hypothetical protein